MTAPDDLRDVRYFLTLQGNNSELMECKEIVPGQKMYACRKSDHATRFPYLDHELDCTHELPESLTGVVFREGTQICSFPKEVTPSLAQFPDSQAGKDVARHTIMSMDQADSFLKTRPVPLGGSCACGH